MFFQKDEVAGPRSVTIYIYFIKDFTKLNGLLYLLGVFCPKVLMIAIRHKRAQYKASLAVFLLEGGSQGFPFITSKNTGL